MPNARLLGYLKRCILYKLIGTMQQESEAWMDGDGLFSIAPAFLLSNRSTA